MKAIGKSQERRQKVIEKPWDNHWKTIGESEGNHWNITGKSLYSGVSQGIRLRILAYLRVSSRGLDILTCPGVSWSVLAYPGGVLRNLGETCGVLRSPAASKKPRFPFLCTHRFGPRPVLIGRYSILCTRGIVKWKWLLNDGVRFARQGQYFRAPAKSLSGSPL